MAERDSIFSSKTTYNGFFSFSDFYNFCYNWLTEEMGLFVTEKKYSEKIMGDAKIIEIKWEGLKEITDYFQMEVKVDFRINNLTKVEINQGGVKIQTNKGSVEMKIVGVLSKDYKGKFETNAIRKILRGVYEKWVIPSRIDEFQGKIAQECDEFLNQAKAYLDLEGKR